MPHAEKHLSCEQKKKEKFVAIKLEGSDEREVEVVNLYENNENEHVGMGWSWDEI